MREDGGSILFVVFCFLGLPALFMNVEAQEVSLSKQVIISVLEHFYYIIDTRLDLCFYEMLTHNGAVVIEILCDDLFRKLLHD